LAYEEAHAPIYFGRSAAIQQAFSRLETQSSVVICGASGSGKSSLMRAGILPKLRMLAATRGRKFVPLLFFPGARPVDALREALQNVPVGDAADSVRWSQAVEEQLPGDPAQISSSGLVHLLHGRCWRMTSFRWAA
jgi:energy-coupling factor transporter ATP-binding protein EcfA2